MDSFAVEGRGAGRELGQRLGLRLTPRELGAPPGQPIDEATDEDGDGDEHEQRCRVAGVSEAQAVRRDDEIPISEEEGNERGRERRPQATQHCDCDRAQQQQEQRAGHAHGVAEWCEGKDHQRKADERAEPRDGRRSFASSRHCTSCADAKRSSSKSRFFDGEHVNVDRSRRANDPVDDGALRELCPARSA